VDLQKLINFAVLHRERRALASYAENPAAFGFWRRKNVGIRDAANLLGGIRRCQQKNHTFAAVFDLK
jgi:hypothetical protein